MKILIAAAAFASIATVSPALAKEQSFNYQGVTYTYSVKDVSDKTRVIAGTSASGEAYRLVVSGNRVRGLYNGQRVSFSLNEAKNAAVESASAIKVAER